MTNGNTGIAVMDTGEIVESAITPKERFAGELETAAFVAKELNSVIEKQKDTWAVSLKGSAKNAPVYLKVEAWQYLGKAYEYRALLEGLVERDSEEPNAWVARVKIFDKFDRQVGSGDSICGTSDEPYWARQATFAKKSMAQTRAISKAYRSCLAWVAVLAGYEPTPYEEMPDDVQGVIKPKEEIQDDAPRAKPPITEKQTNLINGLTTGDESSVNLVVEFLGEVFPDAKEKLHLADLDIEQASDLITRLKAHKGLK
jgi:hypothetical protein